MRGRGFAHAVRNPFVSCPPWCSHGGATADGTDRNFWLNWREPSPERKPRLRDPLFDGETDEIGRAVDNGMSCADGPFHANAADGSILLQTASSRHTSFRAPRTKAPACPKNGSRRPWQNQSGPKPAIRAALDNVAVSSWPKMAPADEMFLLSLAKPLHSAFGIGTIEGKTAFTMGLRPVYRVNPTVDYDLVTGRIACGAAGLTTHILQDPLSQNMPRLAAHRSGRLDAASASGVIWDVLCGR